MKLKQVFGFLEVQNVVCECSLVTRFYGRVVAHRHAYGMGKERERGNGNERRQLCSERPRPRTGTALKLRSATTRTACRTSLRLSRPSRLSPTTTHDYSRTCCAAWASSRLFYRILSCSRCTTSSFMGWLPLSRNVKKSKTSHIPFMFRKVLYFAGLKQTRIIKGAY